MIRIPKKRLTEIEFSLSERDKTILQTLQVCRYLTTINIQKLYYTDHANPTAALRAANRSMIKLQEYGLVKSLKRRIGGVRAGSGAYVWLLTEAGNRMLYINDTDTSQTSRKRFYEPSLIFLKHMLAVSESYVQIIDICRKRRLEQIRLEIEPNCWRGYTDRGGKPATLKPDLFTVIRNGYYEDSWFIEIDLDSESPNKVLDKCLRYTCYYKSGIEQKNSGVFPLVVWIVPGVSRQARLQRYFEECRDLQPKNIFLVILPDEFETLLAEGAEKLAELRTKRGQHE